MHRKIVIPAALAVAVLAAGGTFAMTHGRFARSAPLPTAPPPVPVVAGQVSSHDVPIYLRGVGTVIAYNTVLVRSQIQGLITATCSPRSIRGLIKRSSTR